MLEKVSATMKDWMMATTKAQELDSSQHKWETRKANYWVQKKGRKKEKWLGS